jgi:hypothetical protein
MNTEMSDFVKLILERMDTFPEEFIEGDPKHRWSTLTRGIVDWVMDETDTNSARSLWALEPHEREALTTKYKALYLEQQKRAFLKNILGGDENQGKKVLVTNPKSMLVPSAMVKEATKILRDEMDKVYAVNTLGHSNNTNAYEYGQRHLREPNK